MKNHRTPKVCYAHQMRQIDQAAVQQGKIPSIVLMENAANACVKQIGAILGDIKDKKILVFCSKGNNGGDGFAIARHLINYGADVTVFLICKKEFAGDALTNFEILEGMNANIIELSEEFEISSQIIASDLVVDAMFGTGIKGEIEDVGKRAITQINAYSPYTLSVDIPSGINADTGEICGTCIKADKTVTFAHYKLGMLMYPAADMCGEIICADISIPQYITDIINPQIQIIDNSLFTQNMPKRSKNSQKGDYGKVLIVAGSKGLSGAAYLSSQASMLCGSGLVTLAVPDCIHAILEAKTTESMTLPLPSTDGHISDKAIDILKEKLKKTDALLIGPGLGTSDDAQKVVEALLTTSTIPTIVDADAINCIAKNINILNNCSCDVIITPHSVEFSRISGLSLEEIENDRIGTTREFAKKYKHSKVAKQL